MYRKVSALFPTPYFTSQESMLAEVHNREGVIETYPWAKHWDVKLLGVTLLRCFEKLLASRGEYFIILLQLISELDLLRKQVLQAKQCCSQLTSWPENRNNRLTTFILSCLATAFLIFGTVKPVWTYTKRHSTSWFVLPQTTKNTYNEDTTFRAILVLLNVNPKRISCSTHLVSYPTTHDKKRRLE